MESSGEEDVIRLCLNTVGAIAEITTANPISIALDGLPSSSLTSVFFFLLSPSLLSPDRIL